MIHEKWGRSVHTTYKIFYRALKLANFLQRLVVPLDFVDVHGQVLEDKTNVPFCLKTNTRKHPNPLLSEQIYSPVHHNRRVKHPGNNNAEHC